jgi:DNA polymerase-1
MLLTVHDELVFEVPEEERADVEVLIREVMQGVTELRVPLVVDIGFGPNWAEAK